jgi:site-specific DNA-cytosine methylase
MALLFDALFQATDIDSSGQRSQKKKRKTTSDLQGAAAASGAKRRRMTAAIKQQPEICRWFDVEKLSAKTPAAEVLHTAPTDPIRLGSDFTGYGTDSLAFHFLGLQYESVFVAESSHEKDILRVALEKNITQKEPHVKYSDVKNRSTMSAPVCDVFITGPPCVTFSTLGKRKGASVAKGQLMCYSLRYILDRLPRVVIIENVRGLTHKRNAALLQHVKDCLQAAKYSVHLRVLCTSESAVPQSRGRCYLVGIRSPKTPFQWPKPLPPVGLEHFLDKNLKNSEHPLNPRQRKIMHTLQGRHKGKLEMSWYCFDAGASKRFVSCLKDKCPCLTRSRAGGHYVPRLRRFLSVVEHGRLQGLPRSITQHMLQACEGNERLVRAAMGDAMSLNVLMRVLSKALFSAGMVDNVPVDPWRLLARDFAKCNPNHCGHRVLPDTYLEQHGAVLK